MTVYYKGSDSSRYVENRNIDSFSFYTSESRFRAFDKLYGKDIDGSNPFLKELNLNKYY